MQKITGEVIVIAQKATENHASQIQGFTYVSGGGQYTYVVRDLTKPGPEQNLWSTVSGATEYTFYHKVMMEKQEEFRANLVAKVLNVMYGLEKSDGTL